MTRTTSELLEDAIGLVKSNKELYEEKALPMMAIQAYCFAKFDKKTKDKLKKENPEIFSWFNENFEKGRKLFDLGICEKCKTHNDQDAKFCKNCGAKLDS